MLTLLSPILNTGKNFYKFSEALLKVTLHCGYVYFLVLFKKEKRITSASLIIDLLALTHFVFSHCFH